MTHQNSFQIPFRTFQLRGISKQALISPLRELKHVLAIWRNWSDYHWGRHNRWSRPGGSSLFTNVPLISFCTRFGGVQRMLASCHSFDRDLALKVIFSETNSTLQRPIILHTFNAKNVLIQGIKMINAPNWHNIVGSSYISILPLCSAQVLVLRVG